MEEEVQVPLIRCSSGLEVTGGGLGVVSHAGLVLLRQLADRTGLTAGLSSALPSPLGGHDRGRVFSEPGVRDRGRRPGDQRFPGDGRPEGAARPGPPRCRPRGGR
jgi:hypothetical protein